CPSSIVFVSVARRAKATPAALYAASQGAIMIRCTQHLRRVIVAGVLACLATLPVATFSQDKTLSTQGNDPANAVVVSTEQVKKDFQQRFPGLEPTEVSPTPFP